MAESTNGYVVGSNTYTQKEANVVQKGRVPLQTERYFDLHDMAWQKAYQFLRHCTHM